MSDPLVNKKIDFEGDKGLQIIKAYLSESLTLAGLYCFGIHHQNSMYCNALSGDIINEQQTHYYLLVICTESKENIIADLSDIIKKKSKGQYTVTLLIHRLRSIKQLSMDKCYFFYQAMSKGLNLMEDSGLPPIFQNSEEPERPILKIKSYWKNRGKVSEVFLNSQKMVDGNHTEPIQEVMLQIAMENTALALINTFLGYRPIYFHLSYLFELVDLFCPFAREIFPRNTEQEIKYFDLLSKNISKLRSANLGTVDYLATTLLQRRCQLFYEKAAVFIESEIKSMEKQKSVFIKPETSIQVL